MLPLAGRPNAAVQQDDPIDRIVLREQLEAVARANVRGVLLTWSLAPLVAWRMSQHAPQTQFLIWLACMVVIAAARYAIARRFLSRTPPDVDLGRWNNRFCAVAGAVGLGWAALAWPIAYATDEQRMLVFCILMAISAIGLISFHDLPRAFAALLIPLLAALAHLVMASSLAIAPEALLIVAAFGAILVSGAVRTGRHFALSTRARVEADAAKRAAAAASDAKSRFLANMSHELRTPINGVLGTTGMLLESQLTREQALLARSAHRSSQDMAVVIEGLLTFSDLEGAVVVLQPEAHAIEPWVEHVVAPFRQQAAERDLRFDVELDPALPQRAKFDAPRLGYMLGLLLSNALKFTPSGAIQLKVERHADERWSLRVIDTGVGVSADDAERIFEPFLQIDSSRARRFGGSGIGLPVVRRMARLMGGEVGCTSNPGSGSCFALDLPLAACEEAPSAPEPEHALSGRVMVVDDNPVNMQITSVMLESMGLDVVSATDGLMAVREYPATRPTLILMDCEMPGLDGREATRRIRAEHGSDRVIIVAFTAHGLPDERRACFEAGMDDFLCKPVDRRQLYRCVQRWVPAAANF